MPVVEVPEIGDVHFPDDMPRAEMESAVKKLLVERQSGRLDPSKASTGTLPSGDTHEKFMAEGQETLAKLQQGPERGTVPPPAGLNKPRFPGVEKAIQQYTGPALTAAAGFIPGSMAIQSGIGAGTELVSELAKGESPSLSKIGIAAATPAAARGVGSAFKVGARGVAKIMGKQNLVEGGIQKVEKTLGKEGAEQAAATTKQAAMAVTTPAIQTQTGKVASEILMKRGRVSGFDPRVFEDVESHIRNAHRAAAAGEPIQYNELFESAVNFNKLASKAKGHDKDAYLKMREAMNKDLARLGPEAGDFYKAYQRKASIKDVTEAMRGANPAKAVSNILDDPMLRGVFDESQKHTVQTIARHIGSDGIFKISGSLAGLGILGYHAPGTAAAAALAPALVGALVAAPKVGPFLARSLIGPEGQINKAALPALAQMVRGYLAEQGE